MAHPQHGHPQHNQQPGGWAPPPPQAGGGGGGKALPIAIGAGLAVGVFVGLLLIRGTGSAEAESKEEVASNDDSTNTAAAIDAGVVATPDAQVIAQVDAAPAKPVIPTATLTFAVLPADAEGLEITINGEKLDGTSFSAELPKDAAKKKLTIKATAKGHHSFRHKMTLVKDETIEIALKPRRRGGGTSKPTKPKTGPGGLIDL